MFGMDVMSYPRARVLMIAVVALVAVALVLIALRWAGGEDEDRPADRPEVAATNRAMAAMILDRIPREHTSKGDNWGLDDFPKDSVGAIVNFDSDVLTLHGVATRDRSVFRQSRCDAPDDVRDGCRQRRLEDGSVLRVTWQKAMPEEDPGVVSLLHRRDDQITVLGVSGPEITGDPASMEDLPVAFDDLVDLVTDPAFGMRTSQRYVDEGEAFESWGGGGL